MLVGRLPLQRGSIAGCCMGVAKSMCSVMLEKGDSHVSHGKSERVGSKSINNQRIANFSTLIGPCGATDSQTRDLRSDLV